MLANLAHGRPRLDGGDGSGGDHVAISVARGIDASAVDRLLRRLGLCAFGDHDAAFPARGVEGAAGTKVETYHIIRGGGGARPNLDIESHKHVENDVASFTLDALEFVILYCEESARGRLSRNPRSRRRL